MKTALLILFFFGVIHGSSFAQVIQNEPNDSFGTATSTGLAAGSSGGIYSIGNNGDGPFGQINGNGTGDFDFFSVEARAGQVIVFDVNASIDGSDVDTLIGIYSSDGVLLAVNDDDEISFDSYLRYTTVSDGTYYLVVGNWIPGTTTAAESLPNDPFVGGSGKGPPGGGVGQYEVVITLDGEVYLSYLPPLFPIGNSNERVLGDFVLYNEGLTNAVIDAIEITGPDALKFQINEALPLSIAAGTSVVIDVLFDPLGSLALARAEIEVYSNDIVHPKRVFAAEVQPLDGLLLRLPFDDAADSLIGYFGTPAETSGNDFPVATVADVGVPEPVFERPSLIGGTGFSMMLNDGGSSGNYVLTDNGFPHPASFSYSLWVKPTAGIGEDTLFNRDPGYGLGDAIYGCTIGTAGEVYFRIAGSDIVSSAPGAVADDTVHHIVVTHYDATGFGDFTADRTRLYIDGVLVDENNTTFEIPEYSGELNSRLWIGTRSGAGTGFNGDLDDFQLYNIELSPQQILGMYQTPGITADEVALDPLEITNFVRMSTGRSIYLDFKSRPNKTYRVEASQDLETWQTVEGAVASEGVRTTGFFSNAEVFDEETPQLFVRVVEE